MEYGDIGPFGSTDNDTPHLDQMAKEGMMNGRYYYLRFGDWMAFCTSEGSLLSASHSAAAFGLRRK